MFLQPGIQNSSYFLKKVLVNCLPPAYPHSSDSSEPKRIWFLLKLWRQNNSHTTERVYIIIKEANFYWILTHTTDGINELNPHNNPMGYLFFSSFHSWENWHAKLRDLPSNYHSHMVQSGFQPRLLNSKTQVTDYTTLLPLTPAFRQNKATNRKTQRMCYDLDMKCPPKDCGLVSSWCIQSLRGDWITMVWP
jgi:hypothetical protein